MLASLLLLLLLLIPINLQHILTTQQAVLEVTLSKQMPPLPKPVKKEENIITKIEIKKPIIKSKKKPVKKLLKPTPALPQNHISEKKKEPMTHTNAISIMQSLQQKPWLNNIDKDFQARTAKDDNFKAKHYVKAANKKFVVNSNAIMQIEVKDTTSASLALAHAVVGYLGLLPVDDIERKVDDVPFCATLVSHTFLCPSGSALSD